MAELLWLERQEEPMKKPPINKAAQRIKRRKDLFFIELYFVANLWVLLKTNWKRLKGSLCFRFVNDIAAFSSTINFVNPILYLLYYFFKYLVHFATKVYYARVTVTGERHHRSRNPCILVSNHPSTLLDPLNVATKVDAEINFLANAGLFRNPVAGWLLRQLYCIPVERYQDTGGKPLNNADSFEQASKFLSQNGCLYVAPEGSSFVERKLRKIKTGTARIAFDAEKRNNWQLGLTIQPIGLEYSDPTKFRSELVVLFGKPIRVADFREDYQADPINGVHCLTEAIGERIGELILDCEDGHQDNLLRRLETILQNEKPLEPLARLQRSQTLLSHLKQWKGQSPAAYEAFSAKVFSYFEKIKSLRLSDFGVHRQVGLGATLRLIASLPVFVPGILTHFLPSFITKKITDALNGDYHWVPTYKFAAGVVLYPVFIWLQTWLVGKFAHHYDLGNWLKWAYLVSVIPLGFITEWWLRGARHFLQSQRVAALQAKEKSTWVQIAGMRKGILLEMEQF